MTLRIPESANRERKAWRVRLEGTAFTLDGAPVAGPFEIKRSFVKAIEWPGGGERAVVQLIGTHPSTITVDAAAFGRIADLLAPPAAADSADLAVMRSAGDSTTTIADLNGWATYAGAWGQTLRFTTFKDQRWLDLGEYVGGTTWNRHVVDGPARLAYFVRQELIPGLQKRGAIRAAVGASGIALRVGISSQDASFGLILSAFTTQREQTAFFLPRDAVNKFVAAEITDQELMDASIVLLNGSRTKVDLSARWR